MFFSCEPRLYKRVCPSVSWLVRRLISLSVGQSVGNAFVLAGRDEPANGLFCVYELVCQIVVLVHASPLTESKSSRTKSSFEEFQKEPGQQA